MALIGFEGFDHISTAPINEFPNLPFGTSSARTGTWQASSCGKTAGASGGFALRGFSAAQTHTLTLATTYTTIIVGLRWRVTNPISSGPNTIIQFRDAAGTTHCGLTMNTSGNLFFWRGTTATVLQTGSTVLSGLGWVQIEVKVKIDNATGTFDVLLDGVSELSATGQDTQNSANNSVGQVLFTIVGVGGTTAGDLDDVYICDTTGSSPYNDFLSSTGSGPFRVETLYVTSDDTVAWTPLSSTNASNVDEASCDGNTTYNSASAAATDIFNHGSLSSTPATIYAVDVVSCVYKEDTTAISVRNKLKSGATTSDGSTVSNLANNTVFYLRDSYQTDPNTAAAWTATNLNNTKIGYERL